MVARMAWIGSRSCGIGNRSCSIPEGYKRAIDEVVEGVVHDRLLARHFAEDDVRKVLRRVQEIDYNLVVLDTWASGACPEGIEVSSRTPMKFFHLSALNLVSPIRASQDVPIVLLVRDPISTYFREEGGESYLLGLGVTKEFSYSPDINCKQSTNPAAFAREMAKYLG